MGLEDSNPRLATINPANLIGAAQPVVEPRAVAQLSDAFRQGFITADDITSRVGELGKSKQKAEIQAANEAVSPQAIQARAGARQAEIQAASEAVSPEAIKARKTELGAHTARAEFETASAVHGPEAVQAFFKYAPLTEGYEGPPKRADGSTDWDLVGKEGANLDRQATIKANAALKGAEAKRLSEKDERTGNTFERIFNAGGEDISDPATRAAYSKAATAPFSFKFLKAGTAAAQPAPAPAQIIPAAPAVVPAQTQTLYGTDAQAAADAAEKAAASGTAVVEPKAAATVAAAPVIESDSRPLGSFLPGKGIVTATGETLAEKNAPKFREEIERIPTVQEFRKALPQYEQLKVIESQMAQPGWQPNKTSDLHLVFNYYKSLHPDTRVTEANFKETHSLTEIYTSISNADGPNAVDSVKNRLANIFNQRTLDATSRQQVINETKDAIQGYINGAKAVYEGKAAQAAQVGVPRSAIIDSSLEQLFASPISAPRQNTTNTAAPQQQGKLVTLSTGRKGYVNPDGSFTPAQ